MGTTKGTFTEKEQSATFVYSKNSAIGTNPSEITTNKKQLPNTGETIHNNAVLIVLFFISISFIFIKHNYLKKN